MSKNQIIAFSKNQTEQEPQAVHAETMQLLGSLMASSDLIAVALDSFFQTHGLSYARWQVLMLLAKNGNKGRPSFIAEKQNVSRATMTGLIIGLEKDGFVTRDPCVKDGRQICVTLTAKAKQAVKDLTPLYQKQACSILSGLSDDEAKSLQQILSKIILDNISN